MGIIQDFIKKIRAKKEVSEGYVRQKRVEEEYTEKKKSANERELERFYEEERQKRIKATLERFRKRENDKVWSGKTGNPAYAKNVVTGHKKIFTAENSFSKCPSALNVPNITKTPYIFGGGR